MKLKKEMVLGFLFDRHLISVVLIRKAKPAWQRGRLNGVGGKIKKGETPREAMFREWYEETGTQFLDWRPFCKMEGPDFIVHVFVGRDEFSDAFNNARTVTREPIEKVMVHELGSWCRVLNLDWLVPMARDYMRDFDYIDEKGRFKVNVNYEY